MKIAATLVLVFCSVLSAFSQSKVVTGRVSGFDDGQAIPGANVLVKGTSKGTGTDIDGNYSIELSEGETTLEFSFVGYQTLTELVGERTVVNVALKSEAKELEEVVVVGYGVQKKSDITGATANIKGEELARQPVLTATQAVQGKIAGVQIISSGQPGTSPQIRIRGVGTALGQTNTLYVVDGVLTDDISNINTADIVDMNILKDASAAAIYGSRGANGVVIISTRKGNGNLKVNYSNNIGFRQAANIVQMANAQEYGNYYQDATGLIAPTTGVSTDWYKTILRNALEQNHNISISGSSEKSTYLVNVGYLNDNGILLNNNYKRFTLRVNQDYTFSKIFKAGFQGSYSSSINQNGFGGFDPNGNVGGVYNDAYRAAPIFPSIVDGKYGNTSAYQNVGNPLLDISNSKYRGTEHRGQGSAYLEVRPVSWLTFRTALGGDTRAQWARNYGYKFLNDESTFITAGGNQQNTRSSLNMGSSQSFRWVWDNTVTFNKTFGVHSLTVLAGTTAEHYNYTDISANRFNVAPDPNLWYINVGDASTSQNGGSGDAWARNSYLGRLNYAYKEKYLLTATLRHDGSSRLPIKNRWQYYPSVGIGWVISRESFMDGQNIFDNLKLRASYGKVGNDQIPTNAFTKTVVLNQAYNFGGFAVAPTVGSLINQIIDPNITWEVTEEYDLAVEFALIDSRLSGEVNYYHKRVNNALLNVPILGDVGDFDAQIITNVGTIQNKGLEVQLNWKDKIGDNITYTVGANVTFNQNKMVKLNGGQAIPGGGVGSQGFVTSTDNGHPIGSFYVLNKIGVFNSDAEVAAYVNKNGQEIQPTAKPGDFKYEDVNGDGTIDLKDRVFAGSYQPVAYFGLNLGVTYKRWDFNTSIYGNAGNKVYNGKKAFRQLGTDNIERDIVYNRWSNSNHTQAEPRANVGSLPASTYFIESGTFARINNLTIGYTFPSAALKVSRITNLRIYVTSQNLFTWKKYSGFTSELPGDPLSSGIELNSYPTTRTVAAGINIGF